MEIFEVIQWVFNLIRGLNVVAKTQPLEEKVMSALMHI